VIRKSITDEQLVSHEMWTDIYKPGDMDELVGNEGVVDQLYEWLRDWDDVNIRGNKKKYHFEGECNGKIKSTLMRRPHCSVDLLVSERRARLE
jgi:hypothetical protein